MSDGAAVRPSAKAIDDLIFKYDVLEKAAAAAKVISKKAGEDADVVKAEIIVLVQNFGVKHAEKSRRLAGATNKATITTGTTTTVDDAAVTAFKAFLDKSEVIELSGKFFRENITYQLIDEPDEVLKTLSQSLPVRIRAKLGNLLRACFSIKSKAPSLKVDVVEAS